MKKPVSFLLMLSVALSPVMAAGPQSSIFKSPSGKVSVSLTIDTGINMVLSYAESASIDGSRVHLGPLSMVTSEGLLPRSGAAFQTTSEIVEQSFATPFSKNARVETRFTLCDIRFPEDNMALRMRIYDDAFAYRFLVHNEAPLTVMNESMKIRFCADGKAWVPYVRRQNESFDRQFFNSFENLYAEHTVSEWEQGRLAFLPVLFDIGAGRKLLVTEADLMNYPGMYLHNPDGGTELEGVFAGYPRTIQQGGHNMLQGVVTAREEYIAKFEAGRAEFPWRAFIFSDNDARLLDNDIVASLATPQAGDDYSWVRPGKVAWEWWNAWNLYDVPFETGINNDTYKYYIDFAARNGIEYVILDEGWAVKNQADLMNVVPEIDLPMLVSYGAERGVGIILWAGYWAFDSDMEGICRHYSEMGVKGFKIDFMDRDDQPMVDFHRRAAETAARYRLMVDFHGTYKPTGLHVTYPNVVNYEGVYGLEQMKWAPVETDQVKYDVTVPFIRQVAGPMDYTQGAMRNAAKGNYRPVYYEPMSQGTRCRQLAEYVVFESPLNMLCDSPSNYMKEHECTEFIAAIPTVWDRTVAIDGRVGEYVVVAREKDGVWYIGGINDWSIRTMTIDLDFLGEGEYKITTFRDGINSHRVGRDYVKEQGNVPSYRTVPVFMAPGGGFAMKIEKR